MEFVFSAEMLALVWTLGWVEEVGPKRVIVCSDSAASLVALKEGKLKAHQDLIIDMLMVLHRVRQKGCKVQEPKIGLTYTPHFRVFLYLYYFLHYRIIVNTSKL